MAYDVAPLAGAWIESALPSDRLMRSMVAPLAGAWIESPMELIYKPTGQSRPPRGGVD